MPVPDRQAVPISTAIRTAAYDADARVLEIGFVSGERYRYFEVPADVVRGFAEAESKGRYFQQAVRGQFRYVRLSR